jgi:AraC-like DNA-binding protein
MVKITTALRYIHSHRLFLIPLGVIALVLLFSFYKSEVSIFPGIAPDRIIAFNDKDENGNSKIDVFRIDSTGVTVQYMLKQQYQYPYAGLKFILKRDSVYTDLSGYDFMVLDVLVNSLQNIDVYFHTVIPGFTDEQDVLSYRFLLKTFICQKPGEHFSVPVKSFSTPSWWFFHKSFSDDSLGKETFKEVAEIIVQSGVNNPVNRFYSFTLTGISFHKDMGKRTLHALIAGCSWLFVYFFVFLIFRNTFHEKRVVFTYEPLSVNSDSDESLNRIINYIAKEYKNPDLTVNRIGSEIGILPVKITQILKEKKQCSYKQYLNAIRLAEAKRLLLETDRNIVDIAMKVGYNNVTHFNRIFKEVEGISPRQFRSSNSPSPEA